MSNLLQLKYFVRRAACGAALLSAVTCGGKKPAQQPEPAPTSPLPTAGLAGQKVALMPLGLVAAEDTLRWDALVADRRATLDKADSVINAFIAARAPEVTWVGAAELRHIARRAIPIATDPDQMGTPFLRADALIDVPDPLRYQLRTLMGLVGGRYALVPAGLVFRVSTPAAAPRGKATAELSVVLVDTRVGRVGWRTTARGEGDDPWTALTRAVKSLTPGLP